MDILILTISIGLLVIWGLVRFMYQSKPTPPGPFSFPIVGSLFSLRQPLHRHFAKLSKSYGPILYLKIGMVPYVVINSAETAEQVLKVHDLEFANRPQTEFFKIFSCGWNDLAFLSYGNKWKKMRKISSMHLFTTRLLNASETFRSSQIDIALKNIRQLCMAGKCVNLQAIFGDMIASSVTLMLFSVKDLEIVELISELANQALVVNIGDLFPALDSLDLHGTYRKMNTELMPRLKRLVQKHVEQHKRDRAQAGDSFVSKDFTDSLVSLAKEQELDDISIVGLLVDMIAAGLETTQGASEWAMTELISNPEVMVKAQAELDKVVGSTRMVRECDLQDLPYINAIVKEAMRLHPPLPLGLPHQNQQQVTLNGYTIPAKCRVLVNLWAIGHDEKHWSKPEKFMPERFMNSSVNMTGQHFELIPFSAGRRMCPGVTLATRSLGLTVASFLHQFNWSRALGEDFDLSEKQGSFSVKMASRLVVNASPRFRD